AADADGAAQVAGQALPVVRVERDDQRIASSCRLEFPGTPIIDVNGDGAIHIVGNDLVVDLGGGTLNGRAEGTLPWDRSGLGIVVQGRGVTLRNGAVRGFQVGVLATACDGFTAEDLDLSGNWGAKLLSTSAAEDNADWLWPHNNDKQEWRTRYGAALCIERSKGVTVRRVKAVGQGAQNGIMLDRVDDSKIYDNDCSFLTGWGLAMWRSSRNVISRNAFDFCVRGYSHGVYNRGQDSAGILMFEQCSENLIALNSVTHGGDGIFIFAGNEALGEDLPEGTSADDPRAVSCKGRGCNGNVITDNDCSHAVAHGIELTFSFDNLIARNGLANCGITGIWGGYSRGTDIVMNVFDRNGVDAANPGEQAGISCEHAGDLLIFGNEFRNQGVAVKLWWDEDPSLLRKAWALSNGAECRGNVVAGNRFVDCGTAIQLRRCEGTKIGRNDLEQSTREVDFDPSSAPRYDRPPLEATGRRMPTDSEQRFAVAGQRNAKQLERVLGERTPIGARAARGGREAIIITPEGPYDWSRPMLVLDAPRRGDGAHHWRLLGDAEVRGTQVQGRASLDPNASDLKRSFKVYGTPGFVSPYRLLVSLEGRKEALVGEGVIVNSPWSARFFSWTKDPREDLDGWRRESEQGVTVDIPAMDLRYGSDGPSQIVADEKVRAASLPKERFGMIATTRLTFPAGRWRLRLMSDDGVRLKADGVTLVDRWNWHAPTEDLAEIATDRPREIELEIEHFELDGHSVLTLEIESIPGPLPVPTPN
ncbi:MAG: hypothetical protein FJ253_06335, partial [Phycisphaerae bacterium]|nr:hypothetical protein [Phycisphaerae bacterium]